MNCYEVGCPGALAESPSFAGYQCDACGAVLSYGMRHLSTEQIREAMASASHPAPVVVVADDAPDYIKRKLGVL